VSILARSASSLARGCGLGFDTGGSASDGKSRQQAAAV
jgi:hypothetical protein